MSDVRFTVKQYIDEGWAVVPLVPGQKRAANDWRKKAYGPADFGEKDNLAVKCGEPSGWRIDVDCDAPEAVRAAKLLLPVTGLIHGRPGKPDSHYWYYSANVKTEKFTDVKDVSGKSAMLVEIRSTGGYTVVPPSTWTNKDNASHTEELSWSVQREAAPLSAEELHHGVLLLAIATLLARHWPGPGARHEAIGPLTGFLLQAKLPALEVVKLIEVAATVAGDKDLTDRIAYAEGTAAKFAAGQPVTGGPKLADHVGKDVVDRLRAWLHLEDSNALEEMNARHFIVRLGKDELIGTEDEDEVFFQYEKALRLRYANKTVQVGVDKEGNPEVAPIFEKWVSWPQRREYRRVVFAPPPIPVGAQDYNLWRGFAVQPKPGCCDLFLEHLQEIICNGNDEHARYLCKLLALTVQQPGAPSEVATVLRGELGIGKGIFVRAIGEIFGHHAVHLDRTDQLTGHFNAQLSSKVVVFADEAFWAGDKREIGALKRLITEPTLTITRKGIDSVQETNCVHLFMATNENWAIPAALRERRFFALSVSPKRKGDFPYFDRLRQELDNGGLAAFLDLLLKLPVTPEEIRRVPMTDELRVQQNQSLPLELKWWQDCLWNAQIGMHGWPTFIGVPTLHDVYQQWVKNFNGRILEPIEFARRINHFVTTEKSTVKRVGGTVMRVIALRDVTDARAFFDSKLGTTDEWPSVTPTNPQIPF